MIEKTSLDCRASRDMNSTQFVGFYEIFEKHAVYFRIQRGTMIAYGVATDIVVAFSVYVIRASKVDLLTSFRLLMYGNVLFPALGCNVICFLLVPYILIPYPVVLNLSPLSFGSESTLVYAAIGIDSWLWSVILLYVATVILGTTMILRTLCRIRAKRHEFSPKTYRLHLGVVTALLLCSAILLVQFGLPIAFFFTVAMLHPSLINMM
ncbi:hypothetical protein GCK32_010857 [Trichostrongylus colubriformis]|uniref:Uncharacterized protein n=1 Tax=Trichostrongylus colubriformis TaxID=6319 RepID=A0AAN8IN80_TRICO